MRVDQRRSGHGRERQQQSGMDSNNVKMEKRIFIRGVALFRVLFFCLLFDRVIYVVNIILIGIIHERRYYTIFMVVINEVN